MNEQIEKLKATFHEIFQTDQADLDFGIYRIMRQKREEFDAYLETQLITDLRQSFSRWQTQTGEDLQRQLNEAVNNAIALGFDPDASPRVKELRELLDAIKHRESLEESVLSDLMVFLKRYYKEGDFLSLPRYRKNSYAIEHNGEEVKLHWANADQYYVKTAERFRDYRFLLPDGRAVHFKITAANTEADNNKTEAGKERRFQLVEHDFMREEDGELSIFFSYEADEQKRKREEINAETAQRILQETAGFLEWRKALGEAMPTDKNQQRTLLDKHLNEYTAKNTFDYFIHKDLETFLRRELDFYIKNEIVMLDDIENEDAPRVELYLAKVKALRRIGHKLISFLAQVENFQKRLFLKKKFVIRANYCATLDRVPRELWPDILTNAAQVEEWGKLYAIEEIAPSLLNGGAQLNDEFLEANQNLIIDTHYFSEEWKLKLLASFDDLDEVTDGTLIKADNFHALNLLQERYRERIKCIYIDPPYNTGNDGFMYKDGYQHSSWLAMMDNRLKIARNLMVSDGIFSISIDEYEQEKLKTLGQSIFPFSIGDVIVHRKRGRDNSARDLSKTHDYLLIWGNSNKSRLRQEPMPKQTRKAYKNPDSDLRGDHRDLGLWARGGQGGSEYSYQMKDGYTFSKRLWLVSEATMKSLEADKRLVRIGDKLYRKLFLSENEGQVAETIWTDVSNNANAADELKSLFGKIPFGTPKPTPLLMKAISLSINIDEEVLDFFAGSGTTAHSVINLNREDNGRRKYILVETNEYFDSVTLPRVKKVVYAKEWKDGKPTEREGSSHLLKYFALESHEDAMNNLELKRTPEQEQGLLNFPQEFQEDYLLNYMLETEAQGSQSLLNLDNFASPFDYRLKIAVNGVGETQATPVDLVETFNYLIGLHIEKMQQVDGFRIVRGTTRKGERCLILWRTTKDLAQELADKRLNDFLEKQSFDFSQIDTLYINGDAAIPVGKVRKETDAWQIKLIEAEFLRRMFE